LPSLSKSTFTSRFLLAVIATGGTLAMASVGGGCAEATSRSWAQTAPLIDPLPPTAPRRQFELQPRTASRSAALGSDMAN
jgi:hypothetical protein